MWLLKIFSNKTKSSVSFTEYSIMMKIPVKAVIDYNSKIFVTLSSVDRYISDVIILQLKEMWILLEELNDEHDVVVQDDEFSRSCWKCCWSSRLLICLKHLVSFAKRKALLQWIALGRSFMYIIINSKGPRILPWGTPDITGVEHVLLIDTNWLNNFKTITRYIKCRQFLEQVYMTYSIKSFIYVQINNVKLMA